jgi:hypothetical protein
MRRCCGSLSNASLVVALALGGVACAEKDNGGSGGGEETASDDGSGTDDGDGGDGGSGDDGGGDDGESGDDGTGGDGSGDTGSDGDGGAFIAEPDGGVVGQCDPGLQDCPNPDEKCTAYVSEPGGCCVDANKCVPIIGNKQVGDLCTRTEDNDDCDKGLFCWTKRTGDTGAGVCWEFCVPEAPDQCLGDGGTCMSLNDGALPLCMTECNPLTQDCTADRGCYPAFDTFVCARPAHDEGMGNDGDQCGVVPGCKPGLVCVDTSVLDGCASGACCTPFCDLTDPDPCATPEECTPWFNEGEAPPGLEDLGACTIPP